MKLRVVKDFELMYIIICKKCDYFSSFKIKISMN